MALVKKKKSILLVDPAYKSYYPPLGLMKISSWLKKKGHSVDFVKDGDVNNFYGYKRPNLSDYYDEIYITTLFTYNATEAMNSINWYKFQYPKSQIKVGGIFATLLPGVIEKETGIIPHKGLLRGAEQSSPDYSLFPQLNCSISFTSRGCTRNCKFCAVKLHEPCFFVKEDWKKDIDLTKKSIIFWDNNWFLSPNFEKDVKTLIKLDKPFDFNQGLDCRLFDKRKADLLATTKIHPLRFAFDNHSEEKHIKKAIKLAQKVGLRDIRTYVLYNSNDKSDTPEYFFERINQLNRLGVLSYPMRYRAIDDIKNHYISPMWDTKILRAVKLTLMFYYSLGMIRKNRVAFKKIFGNTPKEFKNKMYEIYEYDKNLDSKNQRHSS